MEMPDRNGISLDVMPTLVRDRPPAEFAALLERRRRLGQDLFDEVWEGVLHVNPTPSGRHGAVESHCTQSSGRWRSGRG